MRPPTAPPASADVRLRFVVIGAVPEAPLEKLACLGSVQRAADTATAGAALSADPAWTAILVLGPDVDSHDIGALGNWPMFQIQSITGEDMNLTPSAAITLDTHSSAREVALAVRLAALTARLQTAETGLETYKLASGAWRMGLWKRDLTTGRITWSPELMELFGVTAAEAPKSHQTFFELVHPEDREEFMATITAAVRDRCGYEYHFRFKHASGEYRWMSGRGRPVFDNEGNVAEFVGSGIDITNQKLIEQELQERELQLRQIGDNLPDGAIYQVVADSDGQRRFVYWSAGIERLTGVPPQEAMEHAENLYSLIHPDDQQRLIAAEERAVATLSVFDSVARMKNRVTGQWRWVHLRSAPRQLDNGNVIWDGIYTDVTQQHEAQRALEQADQRKNEFLAMLGHELRNPLAAIRSSQSLIAEGNPDPETIAWSAAVIGRQSEQLARLVDDLLDVARITEGKIVLSKQVVSAATVLQSACSVVQPLMRERNHQFRVGWSDNGEALVEADPARLEQVLVNLLINAAKYTPAGGHVETDVTCANGLVTILVRDDGIGMRSDEIPAMLELFAQGSAARQEGGLGIGLTVVQRLVEMHGGTFVLNSAGSGQGTTAEIILPTATAQSTPESAPSPISPVEPTRVLVVDDNLDSAEGLARLLRRRGHEVEVTTDGAAALICAKQFSPSYVLLDLGLPGMDGFEVAANLRSSPGGADLKIIAITGYGQDEDRRRSSAAGCDAHLVKPVRISALAQTMEALTPA